MLLTPQPAITYGPVQSRRLGRSLGINVLPAGRKVCSFDCRYCQYGWTAPVDSAGAFASSLPSVRQVLEAVESALDGLEESPAYLTFSGNGEATLHPQFGRIVDEVNAVRDRKAPHTRTAILSNASRVGLPEVREALARLDLRIMKLDVGTEAGLRRYNQPALGITLDQITDGLSTAADVTIQALFTGGEEGNLQADEVEAWIERIASIRPRAVQLYTLDRAAPCDRLVHAMPEQLKAVRARLWDCGIAAAVF